MNFEHKGQSYATSKLSARQQFHLAAKLSPLVAVIARAVGANSEDVVPAIASGLSSLGDKDIDYVLDLCLSVVRRKDGSGWQVLVAPSGAMIYNDLEWTDLVVILWNVIQENLGNFTSALPPGLAGTAETS